MKIVNDILDIRKKLENGEYPNEQAISQGVVLRLLSLLGWPVYDTQIVIPEYKVGGRRVDFALCVPPSKPIIFIEVKQPGNTLGADRQLFEYAFHKGVPFVIVTDGAEWHFYLPAEVGSYEERRVYKLDLLERTSEESEFRLLRYLSFDLASDRTSLENAREDYKNVSKEREINTSIPVAWEKLIDDKDEFLIEAISEKVESICGFQPNQDQILAYLKTLTNPTIKHTIQSVAPTQPSSKKIKEPINERTGRSKLKVSFPDGKVIHQKKVADTFVLTVKYIGIDKVKNLGLIMNKSPLISNKMLNKEKYNWHELGNGLFICTHSNTKTKLRQLEEINKQLNLDLTIELV